jgi:hypothetical protein
MPMLSKWFEPRPELAFRDPVAFDPTWLRLVSISSIWFAEIAAMVAVGVGVTAVTAISAGDLTIWTMLCAITITVVGPASTDLGPHSKRRSVRLKASRNGSPHHRRI